MLDKKTKQDITTILGYLWADELRHYQESGHSKNHIFRVLKRLATSIQYEA